MEPEALRSLIRQTLAEIAPDARIDRLDPKVSFHDQLEIDSVDFMNLMLALEQKLGWRIPEGDYPQLSTLDGCIRYLTPGPGQASPPKT
jgi:acyl carrier protein